MQYSWFAALLQVHRSCKECCFSTSGCMPQTVLVVWEVLLLATGLLWLLPKWHHCQSQKMQKSVDLYAGVGAGEQ